MIAQGSRAATGRRRRRRCPSRSRCRRPRGFAVAALLTAAATLAVGGSADGSPTERAAHPGPPALAVPLNSSLAGPQRAWVVVPMGRLDEALNTFWQLFTVRGGGRWALVTPPGFADNGGLAAASPTPGSLVAGFLPSQLIRFSPLAATSDGGRKWAPGVLSTALGHVPDAIAVDGSGKLLALAGRSQALLAAAGVAAGWHEIGSLASLRAADAAPACVPSRLTAVALTPAGLPMAAAACSRPGAVGVLAKRGGRWRSVAPTLPRPLRQATTAVLRLTAAGGSVSAIVAARTGARLSLFAAWLPAAGRRWGVSAALALPPSARLASSGTTAAGGVFVSLAAGGTQRVEVLAGVHARWRRLADAPAGTQALAFPPGRTAEAFVVRGSWLTVDAEAPGGRWRRVQVRKVPIEYGSSS